MKKLYEFIERPNLEPINEGFFSNFFGALKKMFQDSGADFLKDLAERMQKDKSKLGSNPKNNVEIIKQAQKDVEVPDDTRKSTDELFDKLLEYTGKMPQDIKNTAEEYAAEVTKLYNELLSKTNGEEIDVDSAQDANLLLSLSVMTLKNKLAEVEARAEAEKASEVFTKQLKTSRAKDFVNKYGTGIEAK